MVRVTFASVGVEMVVGVKIGLDVTMGWGKGVAVGFGAVRLQAANKIERSPVSRTWCFMISSFGNTGQHKPGYIFTRLLYHDNPEKQESE